MKIGLDIMGGDFAPAEALKGVQQFFQQSDDSSVHLLLIGDAEAAAPYLPLLEPYQGRYTLIPSTEVIGMHEHPTKALKEKPNSSIAMGFGMLQMGKADAFISAGNTGAMMVGSMYSVKTIEGIQRPTIASPIPRTDGKYNLLLDVGANADCKPDVLYQFGILGSLMMKHVYGMDDPKVGLLSVGEEKEKGNLVTTAAHQLMEESAPFHFIGNVEGRDFLSDKADVIVCEGFTGNVVLKTFESFYYILKKRGINDTYFDSLNYENYGGTPILGVNAPVLIGHGISNARAFKNMIISARNVVNSRLCEIIHESFHDFVPPVQ